MSGTTSAAAADKLAGGGGLLGISELINSLAPIFLGSGTTRTNQNTTTAGTTATTGTTGTTGTSSTVTGAAPNIIQSMIQQMNTALTQATDPTQIQPIIDNIIQQAKIAFAPTLASLPTSGIYNSTSLGLLAGNAAAQAAAQSAATALNFRQQQQTIASNIGNSLLQATKTQDTTTGQQTTQQQQTAANQQQQQTGSTTKGPTLGAAGPAILSALGLPLLTDQLGLTNILSKPGSLLGRLLGTGTPTTPEGGAPIFDPSASATGFIGQNTGEFTGAGAGAQPGAGLSVDVSNAVGNPLLGPLAGVGDLTTGAISGTAASALSPDVAALSALAIPGTQAGAATLGNVAANAINPTANLTDPFVAIPGAASAIAPTAGIGPDGNPVINFTSTAPEGEAASAAATGGGISGFLGDVQSGFQNAVSSVLGQDVGGFLTTPSPGVGTIASQVGDVFDTGFSSDALGTLGGSLASAGASAGLGILGGFAGSALRPNESPVGSQIGQTIGGLAGSFLGPLGSLGGSFLGNLIGGLFGQTHPQQPYFYLPAQVSNGRLAYGNPVTQAMNSVGGIGGGAFQMLTGFQSQAQALNTLLDKTNLKLDSIAGPLVLGQANKFGNDPIPTQSSVGNAFGQFRFTSDDPTLNAAVAGRSFSDPNQLVAALSGGQQQPAQGTPAQAAIPTVTTPPAQQVSASPQPGPTAEASGTPTTGPAAGVPSQALAIVDPIQLMNYLGLNATAFNSGGTTASTAVSSGGGCTG